MVLVALPAVSAQTTVRFETATVQMDPERFDAELEGQRIEGQNSRTLRNYIDTEHGDGDGFVTRAELATYRQAEMDEFNGQLKSFGRIVTAGITVNDRMSLQQIVTDIYLSPDVLGSTNANTTVVRSINASLVFTNTEEDRADVSFAQNFADVFRTPEGRMEWDVAVFVARGPWAVDAATIAPGGADNPYWTGETFEVPYAEMSNFSSLNEPLSFELYDERAEAAKDAKKKGSPAPGAAAVLALAAVAVALARRR